MPSLKDDLYIVERVEGSELRVGDTIKVWWNLEDRGSKPNEDSITKLVKYTGPLDCFKEGARLADFRYNRVGMTIPNDEMFERVRKM